MNATTFDFCVLYPNQSTPLKVNNNETGKVPVIRSNIKRRKLISSSAIIGFECDLCGKISVSKRSLNLHKKRHLNKPKFECEICGKKYASKCAVNEHMIRHKPDEYIRYRCNEPKCNMKFYHKWRLDAHQEYKHHKNTYDFRCDFCERFLANAFSLKRHTLTCAAYERIIESRISC